MKLKDGRQCRDLRICGGLKVTFNQLVIGVPTVLLLLVIAAMILERQMDKILRKDREERRRHQD